MAGIILRGFDLHIVGPRLLSWHLYEQHFLELINFFPAPAWRRHSLRYTAPAELQRAEAEQKRGRLTTTHDINIMKSVLSERHESPSLREPREHLACGASWFVWAVWGAMLLAALAFVWKFGSNVPYWDEWEMVPILAGEQPVDAAWLWSEHNGHRIPLPKLLLLAAYKLTGADFRVGMYANVLALGAVAFIMIWVAKGLRGRSSYADAFFPLVLLHWGHCENFLWTWQLTQVTPVILVFILLIIIVHQGVHLSFGVAVLAGLCLLMLPLCGFPGLVYVPALAIWLGFAGVQYWRSPERYGKPRALVIWGLMSAALLLVALYFVGYQEPAHHLPALHSGTSLIRFIRSCLSTTGQFLSGGFGPAAEPSWPYSGLVMLGLLLLTTGMLLRAAKRARAAEDRFRALALLLFIAATICLALSVGLGRQGYGFTLRYFLLATPVTLLRLLRVGSLWLADRPLPCADKPAVSHRPGISSQLRDGPKVRSHLSHEICSHSGKIFWPANRSLCSSRGMRTRSTRALSGESPPMGLWRTTQGSGAPGRASRHRIASHSMVGSVTCCRRSIAPASATSSTFSQRVRPFARFRSQSGRPPRIRRCKGTPGSKGLRTTRTSSLP